MNFAVLRLPRFSVQALLWRFPGLYGKPVAIASGEGRKAHVTEASETARPTEGLAVTLAMARSPGLLVRARDHEAESHANRLLVASALSLSPRVEQTDLGVCTVDLRGADEASLESNLRTCAASLAHQGFTVALGAGRTTILAEYAAHIASPVLVVRDEEAFLNPLPLAFANPSPEHRATLESLGIRTLGELTALSKSDIGQRLGTEGVRLWQRACGDEVRLLRHVEAAREFFVEWSYEPAIETAEPLLFRLTRFADCLALELTNTQLVAEKLSLTLTLEDDSTHEREFHLPEQTADSRRWLRILQGHLDTLRTESAIARVRLEAHPTRPPQKQTELFETGLKDAATFWENIARVGGIVGSNRIGTPVVTDTWQPDSVFLAKPLDYVPAPEALPLHPPRGLTLRRFRPPWPASVHESEGRPTLLESRELRSAVEIACGPYRTSGAWWKPQGWARETWRVALRDGPVYQIFRTGREWWIEGVLD